MSASSSRPARAPLPALVVLLLTAAVWCGLGIDWGLPSARTWTWDEVAAPQLETWPLRYPPFHRDLLGALTRLAQVAAPQRLATPEAERYELRLLARAVSLAATLATLVLLHALAARLWNRRAALLVPLAYLLVLQVPYYARSANLDAPYVFWFAAALGFWLRAREHWRPADLVAYAACGTLAFLTKDQAVALFVLPTLWLLVEGHRAAADAGARRRWWRAAGASALVLAALVALAYRLPWQWERLAAHVHEMTHGASQRFRMYESGPRGQWQLLVLAGRHTRFLLGTAGTWLVGGALALVLGARPTRARFAPLLLFPLSYYLFFFAPIGYHRDRFFLPIALVAVLFLPAIGERLAARARPSFAHAAVGLLLVATAAPRQLEILERTLDDTRYDAERVLDAARRRGERIQAWGDPQELPRGHPRRFEYWRVSDRPCERLAALDWVVVNEFQAHWRSSTARTYATLRSGIWGFDRLGRFERVREDVIDFTGVYSTLQRASPPIELYRRTSRVCASGPSDWYRQAVATGARREVERFLRSALGEPWRERRVRDDARGTIAVFGTSADGWVEEGHPAVVVAERRGGGWPPLRVAHGAPAEFFPLALELVSDAGVSTLVVLDGPGEREIELPAPAGAPRRAAWLLRSTRSWVPAAPGGADLRQLGVRIVRLAG